MKPNEVVAELERIRKMVNYAESTRQPDSFVEIRVAIIRLIDKINAETDHKISVTEPR